MNFEINNLPQDAESLKGLILSLHRENQNDKDKIQECQAQISYLEEQIKLWKQRLFGKSSEKLSPEDLNQMRLFNEIEEELEKPETKDRIKVAEHTRKKGGKRHLPKGLPRIDVFHKLTEEQLVHGCGRKMKVIGEEITEKLMMIPQQVMVEVHHREKAACSCEGVDTEGKEGAMRIADMPEQIIPQGIATPGLLAYILTSKFADALPFYRQERIFERIGIDLPRNTMCRWAMKVHEKTESLLELMKKDILRGNLIGMDETPLQVLENDKLNSYMWISRGGSRDKPVLLYEYFSARSGEYPKEFLKDYKGNLQSDGYSAYGTINSVIKQAGCWAHARRNFSDILKIKGAKNSNSIHEALNYIRKLYDVEDDSWHKNLPPEKIKEIRQVRAKPLLDKFKEWLDTRIIQVPPKSALGHAIGYVLNEWPRLIVYLENGNIPIDNNLVENAIRPFVVGRKNWLFSATAKGAKASAGIYSLIETAKANGLDPYWYLLYLLENITLAKASEDYIKLLPYNVDKTALKSPSK